ncbi:hypothetical protein DFJ73DRAFT_764003 [Zopfochytrium polystomum]|nr:hypothetical protein DFJ73DRAFT_764003 [Zopfochytrium polystomum]
MSQKLWPLAAIALALASSATGVAGDACYGQTPGAIVCANLRSYYTCGYNAAGSTLTTLPVAQKCCNNQIVASNDPACGAVCGNGAVDGTVVCVGQTMFVTCSYQCLASTSDQSCPVGLVCCPNLGRCDVPGCKQTAPSSCSGVGDGNIVCKSATTFNMCQYGAEVNSADQSCQPGLVCCQGLNRCDVPGCANPSYAPPPTYNPGVPVVPTGTCAGKPDNYVLCTSATTFNICKNGIKPYGDQTCQAGLICCEGSQRCDTTCAADYTPPAPVTQPPVYVPPVYVPPAYVPTPNGACASKPDGYMVCQSKTTLNYCLSGALVKAADQSCPPGLECCEGQQACGYPGCNYSPAPQSCANVKDNQIVCKSLTTFNICSGGKEAAAVAQHCPATTVCCANLNRCDVVGCSGTASPVPPISPPPSPPYNPNPNPAGCTGKVDNQIVCRSATTFNICHGGGFSGLDQNCPANLVCCDNLNRCDWNGCKGTPSPIPKDPPTSGPYNPTPPVQNTGGSCDGKNDGYVTCTSPNTFNICSNGAKASTFDQYCPSGLTCCETTQSCESNCPAYVPPTPPPVNCNGQPDGKMLCLGGNSFTLCQSGLTTPSQVCPSGLVCCGEKGKCDYPGCSTTPYVPPNPNIPVYVPPTINCSGVKDGMIRCTSATSFRICQSGKPASSVDLTCQPGLFCCENLNACDVAGCQSSSYIPSTPIPYNPSDCQNVKDGNIYCTSQTTFNICQNGRCPATYGSVVPASSSGGYLIHAPVVTGLKVATGQSITKCDCSGQPDNRLKCTSPTTFNFCYGQSPVAAYDQSCPAGLTCCEATQRCDTSCYSAPPAYVDPPPPYTPSVSLCTGQANNAVVCTGQSTFNICWNQTMASAVDQSCPYGQVCCSNTGRCDDSSCPSTVTTYVPPPSCKGKKDNQIFCTGSNTFKYCVNQPGLVCCDGLNRCDVDGCPGSTPKYTPPTPPSYIPPAPYTPTCSGALDGSIVCRSKTTFNFCSGGTFIDAADQYCPYGTVCCAETNLCDYAANCGYALPAPTIPSLPAPSCSKIADGGIACISLYQFRYCSKVTVPQYTLPSNICAGLPDNHVACVNTNSFSLCLNQMPSTGVQNCAAGTVCCGNACVYPDDPACGGNPLNPCAQIPDGQMACSDVAKYVLCQNKSPITPSMPCAPGTVCCGNACVFSTDPMCATTPGPNCAPNTYLPPPVYNPPSVVPTTPAGICTGVPDNNIVCTSAKSFNFCLGQSILPKTADQYCPAGTYCCQSLQRCTWYGECPVKPNVPYLPEPCNGLPDNAQLCVSATQFNLCWKGQFTTAVPQSSDGKMACVNPTYYAFCKSGLPVVGLKACPAGQVCCGNSCVDPKSALCQSCAGCKDNTISCTSDTQYTICKGGRTYCCGNACVAASHPMCARPPSYTPPVITPPTPPTPATPPVPYKSGSCTGCSDNLIRCRSKSSFNYCLNQMYLSSPDFSCPEGTVCCADTNICDWEYNCKKILDPLCKGMPNGATICIGSTAFKTCSSGDFLPGMTTCPAGQVCSQSTNKCEATSSFKTYSYLLEKPSDVPTNFDMSASNVCAGVPDSNIACINPSQFSICLGGLPTAAQSCAPGTKCCGNACVFPSNANCGVNICSGVPDSSIACVSSSTYSTCLNGLAITPPMPCPAGTVCCGNACVFSSDPLCANGGVLYSPPPNPYVPPKAITPPPYCPVDYVPGTYTPPATNPCSKVPDMQIVCRSANTFNFCLNQQLVSALDQYCAPGTVCCSGSTPNVCGKPGDCPTTAKAQVCANMANNQILCVSKTEFNICQNGVFASYAPQSCPLGTICCADKNQCLQPEACSAVLPPPYTAPPPSYKPPSTPVNICAGIPDGGTACVNPASIAICKGGSPVYGTLPCPLGTVCSGNQCVSSSNPAYSNVCAGVPDSAIACTSASQFVTCLHSSIYSAPLNCPAGTVCCGGACTYSTDPLCAGAKPYVPSSRPVETATAPPAYTITSQYSAVYSTKVAPSPTPKYTPVPTYSNFVSCMNNAVYTAPLSCQPGTVCCGNACRFPSDPVCAVAPKVPTYTGPTASVVSTSTPYYSATTVTYSGTPTATSTTAPTYAAPSPSPAPVYNNCVGVADYQPSCTGPSSFKYCVSNSYVSNQTSIACSPGMVCCPSTGLCDKKENCGSSGTTTSVYPSGACTSGSSSMFCTSSSTYTLCTKDGPSFTGMKCAAGTVCCPTTNTCDFAYNCPALGTALTTKSSSSVDECIGAPDGRMCSSDQLSLLDCQGGSTATERDCSTDGNNFCCDSTRSCSPMDGCPSLCKDNVGVDARCRSAVSLVICVNESIGESISCGDSGQICCGNTGACTAPEDC